MAKRISESARVIAYFQGASVEAAEAIFGVVAGIMKGRRPARAAAAAKERRPAKKVAETAERQGE